MSWTKPNYLQTTRKPRFLFLWEPYQKIQEVYNSSIWTLHSLHTVFENSIVQSNPILWHSTNSPDFVSATYFNFARLRLLLSVFVAIPTWVLHILCKLHFLLLSLLFLFLYNNEEKTHKPFLTGIIRRVRWLRKTNIRKREKKKHIKRAKIQGTHVPEYKQERRICFSGRWGSWFSEIWVGGKDFCLQ